MGGTIELDWLPAWRAKESGENFLGFILRMPESPDCEFDSGDFVGSINFFSSFIIGCLQDLESGQKVLSASLRDVNHIERSGSRDQSGMACLKLEAQEKKQGRLRSYID